MNHPPTPQAFGPAINRIADVMAHSTQFSFWGVSRLAEMAGVSSAAVSRIINGKINPSFLMVARLAKALEDDFGIPIDPRELVAENGAFPTRFTCDLVRCSGCLPAAATDEFGDLKRAYHGVVPGQWVTSRYPNGFAPEKGSRHAN
jgi:transcriptional regulator with XRE-family HTH domain